MKKILSLVLIATLAMSITGCKGNESKQSYKESAFGPVSSCEIRSNLDMVENRMGNLEGTTAVNFESLKMGTGEGWLPDSTDYTVQGYVTLTDEAAEKYASSYDWDEGTPEFNLLELQQQDIEGSWYQSPDFNKDIFTNCNSGSAWLNGNTLFFRFYVS